MISFNKPVDKDAIPVHPLQIFRFLQRFLKLSTCLLLLSVGVMGQKSGARVENLRLDFRDNCIEIVYDITGSESGKLHEIDLYVIDNVGNVVFPDSLRGDIGKNIRQESLVYSLGMQDNVMTNIAKKKQGERITLYLQDWFDREQEYSGIRRSPLNNDMIELELPNWGELVDDQKQ